VTRFQRGLVEKAAEAGYTPGMKTAVSIPDELFNRAEVIARKSGKSRSQLYQEALAEYLLRRDPGAVTQAMDEVLVDIDPEHDQWSIEAGRRTLERNEW
jgi:predicted transcriptional regulator